MDHPPSFFFQAEDGIRDLTVTGVQTCALPICLLARAAAPCPRSRAAELRDLDLPGEIGRASWRERGLILGVAVLLKKKKTNAATCTQVASKPSTMGTQTIAFAC